MYTHYAATHSTMIGNIYNVRKRRVGSAGQWIRTRFIKSVDKTKVNGKNWSMDN